MDCLERSRRGGSWDDVADEIIATIPPLPELLDKGVHMAGRRAWETPTDSLLHTCFVQTYLEPDYRFMDRCQCYWDRGCAAILARGLDLAKDQERELVRACWAKLKDPNTLPGEPEFWYGDPPQHASGPPDPAGLANGTQSDTRGHLAPAARTESTTQTATPKARTSRKASYRSPLTKGY